MSSMLNPWRYPPPFIFEVTTTGTSEVVTLPIGGTVGAFINWGDGSPTVEVTSGSDPNRVHTYTSIDTYEIRITGICTTFQVANISPIKTQITKVLQWGDVNFNLLNFTGCSNLTLSNVKDVLDCSNMNSFNSLFQSCTSITTINRINEWDISTITNLNGTFFQNTNLNQDINWDTSNVTTFRQTFELCGNFNGNLGSWNVSSGADFYRMFRQCFDFNNGNSSSINNWIFKTTGTISFISTFEGCTSFNQPLNNWNVERATNMSLMFLNATIFNQSLSTWNVNNVTTFSQTFQNAINFNGDVTTWETGDCLSMLNMFNNAENFNQNLNTSGAIWDVSKVTTFQGMFSSTNVFNGTLTGWLTTAAINMSGMFKTALVFNQPVNHFDVNEVTTFREMFEGTLLFNQPLNSWVIKTTGTVAMDEMFGSTGAFDQSLDTFDVSAVTDMSGMFAFADAFNTAFPSWVTSSLVAIDSMFRDTQLFNQPVNHFDVSGCTSFGQLFKGAKVFNQPLNLWDTSNVTSMGAVFFGALAFNQSVNDWDVSKVTSFTDMFRSTPYNQPMNLWTLNTISGFPMNNMFIFNNVFNQDLSTWDITNVTTMGAFAGAFNTTNYDLMLIAWSALTLPLTILFGIGTTQYTAGNVDSGTTDGATTAFKLIDSTQNFLTTVTIGDVVRRSSTQYAFVDAIDSDTQLTLSHDIMITGVAYTIEGSAAAKGRASMVLNDLWTITDGGPV